MPGFDVRGFLGIMPMTAKENLINEAAQSAENTRLEGTDIESWKGPSTILALTSLTPIKTIYKYGINNGSEINFWFQWDVDVDVVKGPIAGDTEERTYWTGDGAYPKKTKSDIATTGTPYPSNHYRMGIPIPIAGPVVTIAGTFIGAPTDPVNTSAWGYTYVSAWGEEGPMSPLSNLGTWGAGQTPHLASMSGAPSGAYNIVSKRIYRSNTGTSLTTLQFVAEIAVATTTYDDAIAAISLGDVSTTRLYTPPPDTMLGLCEMANEMLAGFVGNTVRLSEPGLPYAWPERYEYKFNSPVVAIKGFATSLLVCCQRGTYVLSGTDPSNMAQEMVVGAGICLAKRGMVAMIGGVCYPTKMGLQYVGPDGVQLLTKNVFDERSWGLFAPTTFTAAVVNNRYLAFYDNGVSQGTLVFSSVEPRTWSTIALWGTAMFADKGTDVLYVVISNIIKRWDSGSALLAKWRSKVFTLPVPCSLAFAKVKADAYPVTWRLYTGTTLLHTETVADGDAFILSTDDQEFDRYEFEYEGTTRVTHVAAATSIAELRQV